MYINCFSNFNSGYGSQGCRSSLIYALMDLRVILCMDSHLEPLLVLMIVTPHPVHTHSRSSLYIYKVLEHLQQWLRVIEMSLTPHPRKTHSYHRFCVIELKQQSRNYIHVGNPPTCRKMSCRVDTLADMQCGCVGDMTKDMSPTCLRHNMPCLQMKA